LQRGKQGANGEHSRRNRGGQIAAKTNEDRRPRIHNHKHAGGHDGRAQQPRREAQQPGQRRLHQPRQLSEQRRGHFGRRTDHRGRRSHDRQGQRRQAHGQEL